MRRLLALLVFVTLLPQSQIQSQIQAQTYQPPSVTLPPGVPSVDFPATAILMATPAGEFPLFLELALGPRQWQRGLMYRPNLPDDYAMLFLFNDDRPRSFWMRNTLSPLDIVYIRADGTVDSIVQGEPLSEESLPSAGPVRFVLELRQGLAQRYGLTPGAAISFRQ